MASLSRTDQGELAQLRVHDVARSPSTAQARLAQCRIVLAEVERRDGDPCWIPWQDGLSITSDDTGALERWVGKWPSDRGRGLKRPYVPPKETAL
jgi:hypothetical protein